MSSNIDNQIEKESVFGVVPVLNNKRIYSFFDAFLVLSGYCIATWSYTQGAYLTSLVSFQQLLIGVFFGAILMLTIYQLPVILSVRYGIDIWIWLRSVFGTTGVKVISVIIIIINFPWYAVCADLFASSMTNLAEVFKITVPKDMHTVFAIVCVVLGTIIAHKGINTITWTTRILVPLLLVLGLVAVIIGFRAASFDVIWNYRPVNSSLTSYIVSIEANFAFVITLVGGMAAIPRLTKKERSGFWAGVFGQGISGSFFVVVGAVMAISMKHVTGTESVDPTLMLATLSTPIVAISSLLLVAFANIGTQAVGSYIYAVMLKSTFKKTSYNVLIWALAIYIIMFCVWGKIIEYFGSFLTISACVYAPLAALLFVDFFFVRKQKLDLKSAFEITGHNAYKYTKGFNLVGFFCMLFGIFMSLFVYNPITSSVNNQFLFYFTPTGFSFLSTAILYYFLSKIPVVKRYII